MTICGTGHRPPKLHRAHPYSESGHQLLTLFAEGVLSGEGLEGVTEVISGMAQGWDLALALAAQRRGIPVIAAIPCRGHEYKWPHEAQERYKAILFNCYDQVVVFQGPYDENPGCMQQRNIYMVDNSDSVLALWDGSFGDTKNCVDYAVKVGSPVVNVWDSWNEYRELK